CQIGFTKDEIFKKKDVCSQQFRPRSSSKDVCSHQFRPRSSSNDF
ncbi:hypothetical protein Tco_0577425, partial [Tanacetum coccineum]